MRPGTSVTDRPAPRVLVLDGEPFMVRLIPQTLALLGVSKVTGCNGGLVALDLIDSPDTVPGIIIGELLSAESRRTIARSSRSPPMRYPPKPNAAAPSAWMPT